MKKQNILKVLTLGKIIGYIEMIYGILLLKNIRHNATNNKESTTKTLSIIFKTEIILIGKCFFKRFPQQ